MSNFQRPISNVQLRPIVVGHWILDIGHWTFFGVITLSGTDFALKKLFSRPRSFNHFNPLFSSCADTYSNADFAPLRAAFSAAFAVGTVRVNVGSMHPFLQRWFASFPRSFRKSAHYLAIDCAKRRQFMSRPADGHVVQQHWSATSQPTHVCSNRPNRDRQGAAYQLRKFLHRHP